MNLAKDLAGKRDVIQLLEKAMSVLDRVGCYNASALVSAALDEVEASTKLWDAPYGANVVVHDAAVLDRSEENGPN